MMLVDEGVQTTKFSNAQCARDGLNLWNKQRENIRIQKLQEQKQAREMLERYWPWGQHAKETKPRGLRNLRLEGLFPQKDFDKAKRSVGLDWGRPGGGAPNINDRGRKIIHTREDPMLRFQWGNDMRQTVDNKLRYRTGRQEQEAYKRELDKLVEEKIKQKEKERLENVTKERELLLMSPPWGKPGPGGTLWRHHSEIGINFFKSLGYTKNGDRIRKENWRKEKVYDEFKRTTLRPPNQITKHEKVMYPRKNWCDEYHTKGITQTLQKRNQLSPLHNGKENGIELVPLIVQKRGALKIPLGTTDVTRNGYRTNVSKWPMERSSYLQDLTEQMKKRHHELKETRLKEVEVARKHFTTWDAFWGRPGHGAPRSSIRKGCIEKMLFPKMIPMAVAT